MNNTKLKKNLKKLKYNLSNNLGGNVEITDSESLNELNDIVQIHNNNSIMSDFLSSHSSGRRNGIQKKFNVHGGDSENKISEQLVQSVPSESADGNETMNDSSSDSSQTNTTPTEIVPSDKYVDIPAKKHAKKSKIKSEIKFEKKEPNTFDEPSVNLDESADLYSSTDSSEGYRIQMPPPQMNFNHGMMQPDQIKKYEEIIEKMALYIKNNNIQQLVDLKNKILELQKKSDNINSDDLVPLIDSINKIMSGTIDLLKTK